MDPVVIYWANSTHATETMVDIRQWLYIDSKFRKCHMQVTIIPHRSAYLHFTVFPLVLSHQLYLNTDTVDLQVPQMEPLLNSWASSTHATVIMVDFNHWLYIDIFALKKKQVTKVPHSSTKCHISLPTLSPLVSTILSPVVLAHSQNWLQGNKMPHQSPYLFITGFSLILCHQLHWYTARIDHKLPKWTQSSFTGLPNTCDRDYGRHQ